MVWLLEGCCWKIYPPAGKVILAHAAGVLCCDGEGSCERLFRRSNLHIWPYQTPETSHPVVSRSVVAAKPCTQNSQ